MLTARTPAGARSLASCSRRAYSLGEFDKELAGVTDVSWKSGQKRAQGKRASATISSFHNNLPPTGGSNSGLYNHLRVMARDSDLYRVITEQPISRKGVPFNPWTLLLELLDDPRIIYSGGPKAGRILLDAVSWMGWVTPQNISTRRTELVYALRASNCIKVYQRLMLPTCQSNVELTPAQSIQFQQIQWPRHIAEKYAELLSVPSIASQDSEPAVSWAYTWLIINLCMLELKAAYTKNRVIFNRRLDTRRRLRQVVQDAVAYAPGVVLNAILCWRENPTRIIGPYVEEQILDRYFADASTLKAAVGSAWQLYDHLIHNNPHQTERLARPQPLTLHKYRMDDLKADNAPLQRLSRGLSAFDNLEEAINTIYKLQKSPSVEAFDRRLVERFMYMRNAEPAIEQ